MLSISKTPERTDGTPEKETTRRFPVEPAVVPVAYLVELTTTSCGRKSSRVLHTYYRTESREGAEIARALHQSGVRSGDRVAVAARGNRRRAKAVGGSERVDATVTELPS